MESSRGFIFPLLLGLALLSGCEPARILVLDSAVEAAYGGSQSVTRAARGAGSVRERIRPVYLDAEAGSAEQVLRENAERYSAAQIVVPAIFLDLVEELDNTQLRRVVILGADTPDEPYAAVFFDEQSALGNASDAIGRYLQDSYDLPQPGETYPRDNGPEHILLIIADERSVPGRRRTDTLLNGLERHEVPREVVSIERFETDPSSDELRRTISRFGNDGGLVVSTLPDYRGVIREETADTGIRFAALYPSTHGRAPEEQSDTAPALELVGDLEAALRAAQNVNPGESRAVELELLNRL